MIIKDKKVYRNLEEQVEENKSQIDQLWNTERVLAQLGIKVIGVVENPDHLPDPTLYEGDYGDSYAVGVEPPYVFYVFTRRGDVEDEGYWFNIGQLAITGAPGPKGDKGDTGSQGPKGDTGAAAGFGTPTIFVTDLPAGSSPTASVTASGNNTAKVFSFSFGIPKGDKGDQGNQGIQGPKGDTGDPGGFIHIRGRVANVSLLPTPPLVGTDAYFVGTASPDASNPLYIWTAENMWQNIGVINLATYCTVGGSFVGQFDLDTKLNKKTDNGTYVYTHIGASQSHQAMSGDADANSVALRTNGGQLRVATPSTANDAANKSYVDNALTSKLDSSKAAVSSVGGLVIPSTTPTSNELVGINTSNAQTRVTLGNGLDLTGNVLSSTATSNLLVKSTFYGTASGGYLVPFLSATQVLNIYNAVKAGQSASIMDLNEEYICPIIGAWEDSSSKIHVYYLYEPYKIIVEFQRLSSTSADAHAISLDLSNYLQNPGTKGSSTVGLYLSSGGTFQTTSTYCGGTAVVLNGSSKSGTSASFYAPTTVGTSGYVLKSNGSGAPTWIAQPSFSLSGDTLTITLP